jgi:MoxR-like ATPase
MGESAAQLAKQLHQELSKVIVGQNEVIDQLLAALLAGGHVLLEGVPGIAKTLTVKALARLCRLEFQRIQCTPDLMPGDILGVNIYNTATGTFAFRRGPVFTDLLLVDEINRMPPRSQAALLECMEERQVTLDGTRYPLSDFFTAIATQNPVEFEGTYPLPEAQLDRFLVKIQIGYPNAEDESEILNRYQNGFDPLQLDKLGLEPVDRELLAGARRDAAAVRVEATLFRYIGEIVRRTRTSPLVSLGGSPRASVALLLASKSLAAMDGRDYVVPDDIKSSAPGVLRHRLVVKPEADLEGITPDRVVSEIIASVEVPQ